MPRLARVGIVRDDIAHLTVMCPGCVAEARRQLAETRAFHEKWRQEILGHHAEDMKAARKGVGVALFVGFCAGWFVSFLVFGG